MGGSPSRVTKADRYADDPATVDDILNNVDTGDVILFRGNGATAQLVRLWEWCNYSHVGMVHKRTFPGCSEPLVCLWESVGHLDTLPCLLHGRQKTGPRLVSLRDKLNGYIAGSGGWQEVRICVVKLIPQPLDAWGTLDANLMAFQHQICGHSVYPTPPQLVSEGMWTLPMGAPIHSPYMPSAPPSPPPPSVYTCEKLIAVTLVRMQAYQSTLNVDRIHLPSFIDGSISEQDRHLAVLDVNNYHWTVKRGMPPHSNVIHYA